MWSGDSFRSTSQWKLNPNVDRMALWPEEGFCLPLKEGQSQALVCIQRKPLGFLEKLEQLEGTRDAKDRGWAHRS